MYVDNDKACRDSELPELVSLVPSAEIPSLFAVDAHVTVDAHRIDILHQESGRESDYTTLIDCELKRSLRNNAGGEVPSMR
jgi:hypothetical protein